MTISRGPFIGGALLLVFLAATPAWADQRWEKYKSAFITSDGRVLDYYQKKTSHSEGQGYAMLLAVAYNDRATFDRLLKWTRYNLGVRKDGLLAWHFGERPNGQWGAIDYNNATDGDILVAWALLEAHRRWKDQRHREEGIEIVGAVRKYLAVHWKGKVTLAPSYNGYSEDNGYVINPSYFVFSAFSLFAREEDPVFWNAVHADSLHIVSQMSYGSWGLPADWVILTDGGRIESYDNHQYGYAAVRIPFYLAMDRQTLVSPGFKRLMEYFRQVGHLPRWVDFKEDAVSLQAASAGMYASYALAAETYGDEALARRLWELADKTFGSESNSYYSATLYLLAKKAEALR